MDTRQLRKIADQVTSKLTPSKVEILDATPYSARVRVVSDAFANTALPDRFEELYGLFYAPGTISKTFLLTFEAWTTSEYAQITKRGSEGGSESGGGNDNSTKKKVASPTSNINNPLS